MKALKEMDEDEGKPRVKEKCKMSVRLWDDLFVGNLNFQTPQGLKLDLNKHRC